MKQRALTKKFVQTIQTQVQTRFKPGKIRTLLTYSIREQQIILHQQLGCFRIKKKQKRPCSSGTFDVVQSYCIVKCNMITCRRVYIVCSEKIMRIQILGFVHIKKNDANTQFAFTNKSYIQNNIKGSYIETTDTFYKQGIHIHSLKRQISFKAWFALTNNLEHFTNTTRPKLERTYSSRWHSRIASSADIEDMKYATNALGNTPKP